MDDEPRISIGGKEGQTTLFTFTVTFSATYDQAVTLSFTTVNGTAKASDRDYIAKTGGARLSAGHMQHTFSVPPENGNSATIG